jgi:hypothetical protein
VLILSLFLHIAPIQLLILLQHPLIRLVEVLLLFFVPLSLAVKHRDLVDNMMGNEGTANALVERLVDGMHSRLDLGWIAVDGQV